MKKLMALAALLTLILAGPVHADDTPSGVASDVNAVQKDNAALAQKNAQLAKDRAAKAKDKATNSYGSQAVDSVKIGADKLGRSEKEGEKSTDTKTLNGDVNNAVTK